MGSAIYVKQFSEHINNLAKHLFLVCKTELETAK